MGDSDITGSVLLSCFIAVASVARGDLQLAPQEQLIEVIFGEAPPAPELDANGDGTISIADVVLLGSILPETPTGTPLALATATPTPSGTPTLTATATAVGFLFGGSPAELAPHGLGDKLIYQVTGPDGVTSEIAEVVSSAADGGFVIDVKRGTKHEAQSFRDTGRQVVYYGPTDLVRGVRTTCQPPLLRLSTPVMAGEEFSTLATCEIRLVDSNLYLGQFMRTDTYTPIDLVEAVAVPAGTYTGVLHLRGTTTLGQETSDIYLAPGVGVIHRVAVTNTGTYVRDLVDGTIAGQSVRK